MGKKKSKAKQNPAKASGFAASGVGQKGSGSNAFGKVRLDQLLVDKGLVESRSKAQALVMAGKVYTETKRLDKPGQSFNPDTPLTLKGKDHPWVSRGGVKLAHGLEHFGIDPAGFCCADIGSSTGGFTDVLLIRGAEKVYAVDVGTNQLDYKLRIHDQVVVMEQTNARHLTAEDIPDALDMVVSDVSFISIEKALPGALALVKPGGRLLTLVKPQFEVGKGLVGKGGVVRDPDLHKEVCDRLSAWLDGLDDWTVEGLTASPIKGPEGNVEFLLSGKKAG